MRRRAVVVVEPLAELREHRLGIAQIDVAEIIALEGPDEGFGEAVALRAVRRRRDGHQAELVRVEDRGRRGVLRVVVAEPLNRVRGFERGLAEARPQRAIHERADVGAGQRARRGHVGRHLAIVAVDREGDGEDLTAPAGNQEDIGAPPLV